MALTPLEERGLFLAAAHGDLGVFLGLTALRKVENGGPGREMGVLSVPAPTFDKQIAVAANSFRRRELKLTEEGLVCRTSLGLFTEDFLRAFSRKWAPLGAENDPKGLNAHHASNLVKVYATLALQAIVALKGLKP